ncbi:unnamed protein product [Clonostachys solani]|uniref:Uncharacterized protein n=1 Tax=Clonostachys solani TaxID=160281 RepID=A0A9N9ZEM1_9HYPO|nr:unnamed protein product [Clonostachys solani]
MQVVETLQIKLRVDYPSTLTSIANLTSTYRNQGRQSYINILELRLVGGGREASGAGDRDL